MRTAAAILALISLFLLLSTVSADTDARVVEVEGSLRVVHPDDSAERDAGPGQEIPQGSKLIAAEGCSARIELPGLGVLAMTGPATARLTTIDGHPAVVLLAGNAAFDFQSGKLVLQVDGGRLELAGVGGYTGALVEGTSFLVSGDSESARVEVRGGSSLLSGDSDHIRLTAGDAVFLPPSKDGKGEDRIHLRSREGEIQLPTEAVKSLEGSGNPNLAEMQKDWGQDRESPRIP